MIDKIFKFLKIHYTAEAKLIDGTPLFIDGDLEKGSKIQVITQDGKVDMPDGDYVLDNGANLVVKGGMIENVSEPEDTIDEVNCARQDGIGTSIDEIPTDAPNSDEISEKPTGKIPAAEIEEMIKKISDFEERIKTLEEKLTGGMKASADKVQELSSQVNDALDKITLAREVKKNVIEDDAKETLLEKRIKYISEIRNKK